MPGKRNRQQFIYDRFKLQDKYAEIQNLLIKADKEAASVLAEAKETKTEPDYEKIKEPYLKIYDEYKDTLWMQYEDFYKGPEKYDKDTVLEWIDRNIVTIALLSDTNFREKIASKNSEFSQRSFGTTRMSALCEMATSWLKAYGTEYRIKTAVEYDGTEKEIEIPEHHRLNNYDLATDLSYAKSKFNSAARFKPKQAEYLAGKKSFGTDYSADQKSFSDFTEKLSDALTSHDSNQYKDIIDAARTFSLSDEIGTLSDKNETADLKKLNQRQYQALKMFLLKEKIDKYVQHKTKDGIKQNAFPKLELVEELDKFVCARISELDPQPFTLGKRSFNPKNVSPAATDGVTAYFEYKSGRKTPDSIMSDKTIENNPVQTEENTAPVHTEESAVPVQTEENTAPVHTEESAVPVQIEENTVHAEERKVSVQEEADPTDYFERDKDELADFAKKLDKAKTGYNSSVYKNIIKCLDGFSKTKNGPWSDADKMSSKQNHAAKLLSLRSLIDEYVQHKANDGVKKNTYHKLAAVEELRKYIDEKITEMKPAPFAKTQKPLDKLNVYITGTPSVQAKSNINRTGLEENVEYSKVYGGGTDKDECTRTLDFMDRIIGKAKSASQKNDLKKMQQEFLALPGKYTAQELKDLSAMAVDAVKQANQDSKLNPAIIAALSQGKVTLDETERLMFQYTLKHNLPVDIQTNWDWHASGSRSQKLSAKEALALTLTAAKKYRNREKGNWDEKAQSNTNRIVNEGRTNMLKVIDGGFKDVNDRIKSPEDMVREWPGIDLAAKAYKSLPMYSSHHTEARNKIVAAQEKRMIDLVKLGENVDRKLAQVAENNKEAEKTNIQSAVI